MAAFGRISFTAWNVFPIEVPRCSATGPRISCCWSNTSSRRYGRRAGKNFGSIDKKTLHLLQNYDWPGNIRELQNVIERSVVLNSEEVFAVDESWLSKQPARRLQIAPPAEPHARPQSEREMIEAALAKSRGRVAGPTGAAQSLGVPPSTLDHRIKALGIDKTRFKFR